MLGGKVDWGSKTRGRGVREEELCPSKKSKTLFFFNKKMREKSTSHGAKMVYLCCC